MLFIGVGYKVFGSTREYLNSECVEYKGFIFSGGLNIVLNYMDINGNGFASLLINWYCEGMLNIAFS